MCRQYVKRQILTFWNFKFQNCATFKQFFKILVLRSKQNLNWHLGGETAKVEVGVNLETYLTSKYRVY